MGGLAFLLLAGPAVAQVVNPFEQPAAPAGAPRRSVGDDETAGSDAVSSTSAAPSFWQKMSSGTADFFRRTGNLIAPSSAPQPPPSPTGTRRVYQGKTPPADPPSGSRSRPRRFLLDVLFPEPEDPPGPESVIDFLSQPRPQP